MTTTIVPSDAHQDRGSKDSPVSSRLEDDRPPVWAGRWWTLSVLVSLILVVCLMLIWQTRNAKPLRFTQLTTIERVNEDLDRNLGGRPVPAGQVHIPTGIFVQTMQLQSDRDVRITGYVWQSFVGDVRADIERGNAVSALGVDGQRGSVTPGVFFPDQVDSSFKLERRYLHFNAAATDTSPPKAPADPNSGVTTATTSKVSDPPNGGPGSSTTSATLPPGFFRSPLRFRAAVGTTVVGWYFEAPIHQSPSDPNAASRKLFTDTDYPFDHKVVRVRMWPADFEENVVLVPDFQAYPCQRQPRLPCTGPGDVFGIDTSITMGEFAPENTYFDYYRVPYYNSDFGLNSFQQENYPELQFNVLIRRNLANALVSNLVPFSVAAGLAFAVLLTISSDDGRSRRFTSSLAQVMTSLAAIFLAVLIAHQQLRQQFGVVVYLDYFYFLLYLVLLGVAINALLVNSPQLGRRAVFTFGNNLISQILYWPTLVLATVVLAIILL